MKRQVFVASGLLTTLAVLTLSAAGMAQDGKRTSDEACRVVYGIDDITGEYLFADDAGAFVFNPSESFPLETAVTFGNAIQMNRIAELPMATTILTTSKGFDMDHDGQREFIIRVIEPGTSSSGLFQFYESTGDNSFALVHAIEITDPEATSISYYPGDVGDTDNDGLTEAIFFGRILNDFHVRVYESKFTDAYPTELVWEVGGHFVDDGNFWQEGAEIADTDGDGWQEIIVADLYLGLPRLNVYENDGDNSYRSTYSEMIPGGIFVQSQVVLNDFDEDGKDEILIGGVPPSDSLIAYESTGDDSYGIIWTWLFDPLINIAFIVDAGDLDGDGKKEFLAGGFKPGGESVLHVFEAVGDNDFEIVASLTRPNMAQNYSAANVADVDGNGTKEIIFGTTPGFSIYENQGLGWIEIWSEVGLGPIESIGAGDHDGDGKDEILVRDGDQEDGVTVIYEIDSADAADMDSDHVVDVIDNCPLTPNSSQEDADSDTVGDVCDNCIYGPNPTQGPAIFGQEIQALDSDTFSWGVPAEIVYATGDLSLVSTYAVGLVDTLPLETSLVDLSVPVAGEGFYYLLKPSCAVGSWQTTLGAEPGRDAALP